MGQTDREGFTITSLPSGKSIRATETPIREAKRKKIAQDEQFEDLPKDTVCEIIATIDDPNYMTGPDVSYPILLLKYMYIFGLL